jgi:Transposase DDE domain
LPAELASQWPGTGPRWQHGTKAALTCQVLFDLRSGRLQGPWIEPGKASDQRSPAQHAARPAGALRLADLGYFDLDVLARLSQQQAFWLTRWQPSTALFAADGMRRKLAAWLGRQTGDVLDVPVTLGTRHRRPCRLLAMRVPAHVAAQRRRRLRRKDRRRGKRKVRAERLALCAWTILLTNVPVEQLTATEAVVLARARWQVELLFKLWTSEGGLDVSRSAKPYRRRREVLAKLIAAVVQHWVLLASGWSGPQRSLRKAARVVRQQAVLFARGVHADGVLQIALEVLGVCVQLGTRITKRRKNPATYQLLHNPALMKESLA